MKAVIYARYSSDSQREESIEGQIRECTAFAGKNGITVLRHYIDRAFSAKTDNRPEFQNMIKDSGKRLFDMIIVWKLDRFARNRYDSARYKAALKKNGVKVVSATEVISDGAEGIILESVLEGYAEYYSADLSEKVVRGMTENALKCKYNGGTLPIGYQIDSEQYFQLDPLTAPFVREAFQRYDEGATMTQIRDWLNEQGVKNTRGQKMSYNSVQHLLSNRRYIGEYTYRDIVVPDGIPAIVPQDLFDRVQEKLAKNRKAPARHKAEDDYLLTTKLFCGYCGAYLCGESGTSHTGNVHHYYKCVSVKKKRTECHKKSVRKEWIEDLVVNETMKMVMDDKAIEAIVSMLMDLQDRENVNLPLYEQQLREADTAIQNLLNAIQQGILTKSTKSRLEELEATKEELETRIACEKLAKPKVSAEFMTFWLHRFRKLDVRQKSHRKMLIDTFINAIFLYDDKMVITFNYKDGTDTITFDDLKTALADMKTGSDLDCSTAGEEGILLADIVGYPDLKNAKELAEQHDYVKQYRNHLKIGGYKIILDGSPQGRTAWMSRPYEDAEDGYRGYPVYGDEELQRYVDTAYREDMQLLAHCNGDAAAEQFLNAAEKAAAEIPDAGGKVKDIRPVMIHAQFAREDQIRRMPEISMIPSFFAAHTYYWGDVHLKNFGQERAEHISPVKTAADAGVIYTLHQDTPVIEPDMLETVWCAVNRITKSGVRLAQEEAVSCLDALKGVTVNAAFQYHEEQEKGSIEEGKRADLIILSEDPLQVHPDRIRGITVLETIKDGEAVYRKDQ